MAICPAAGQIAFETFFCYLSGGRTNSLKWYQMLFVRLPRNRIWKLFDWPCSCCHVIVLYCNLMGYPSNLVGTGGGGGGYSQKYEDVCVQVLIAFNDWLNDYILDYDSVILQSALITVIINWGLIRQARPRLNGIAPPPPQTKKH